MSKIWTPKGENSRDSAPPNYLHLRAIYQYNIFIACVANHRLHGPLYHKHIIKGEVIYVPPPTNQHCSQYCDGNPSHINSIWCAFAYAPCTPATSITTDYHYNYNYNSINIACYNTTATPTRETISDAADNITDN